ncbi:MAG: hypothetical protein USCAAHI_02263 [Beijerinckiaceae bacterium]|nr:MAG: hypothetical protein USCAAHI_02263 [Beijerinckiaceae bacterium]
MGDLADKSDSEIEQWIRNHEAKGATSVPFYRELLDERARRTQLKHTLNMERSLDHLKEAAIRQKCTTYGDLGNASGIEWSHARHQMNGPHGHLDRLLELCYARGLPLLTPICVNQDRLEEGELGDEALAGFVAAARRMGLPVTDERAFHLALGSRAAGREHMNQLVAFTDRTPALVAAVGERASYRFFEFFTAQIRNPNTRRAYARAVQEFLAWCEQHGVTSIAELQPLYIGT